MSTTWEKFLTSLKNPSNSGSSGSSGPSGGGGKPPTRKPPKPPTPMGSKTYAPQPTTPTRASANPYYPGASNFTGSMYSGTAAGTGSVGKPFHGGHDTPGGASNRPGYGFDDPVAKAGTDFFAMETMKNTELGRQLGVYPNLPDRYDTPNDNNNNNGGGGGGGGGYGGGMSADQKAMLKAQADSLAAVLGADRWGGRDISGELQSIDKGVSADQASAKAAWRAMQDKIKGQGNSFRDMKHAAAPVLAPELAELLRTQGGDAGAYRAELGLADTQAAAGRANDVKFRDRIAAGIEQEREAALLANAQSDEYGRSELEASGSAMSAVLRERKRLEDKALQDQKMQVLMQLIQANAQQGVATDVAKYMGAQ